MRNFEIDGNPLPDILLVHISDLHVKDSNSIALARLEQLAPPIGQCIQRPSHVVLLLTGDIAFSGTSDEYNLASTAIEDLVQKLGAWNPLSVRIYCSPGNHDCDFNAISPKIHQSLLKDIGTDYEDVISVVRELTSTQKEFNIFRDVICSETRFHNELLSTASLDFEGRTISLSLINSSWSSKLRETPGALRLPAIALPTIDLGATTAIALVHHPINWYSPEDVRGFSSWLDKNVDIALWGHEHQEDDVERRRKSIGSSVRDFLANPIEDKTATCGFSVLTISGIDNRLSKSVFAWTADKLKLLRAESPELIPINPGRSLGKLRFSHQYQEFLDDPGGSFQHPRLVRNLRLSEVLIYPELRPLDDETTDLDSPNATTSIRKIAEDCLKSARTIIFGSEQSGKTTAAKIVATEANRLGTLPLYLDAGNLRSVNQSEITAWINAALAHQFEPDCLDEVKQKEPSEKLLIIDNFQLIPAGSDGIARVLDRVQLLAGSQLFLSSDSPATAVLSADPDVEQDSAYWTGAKCFELLALGHKQRGDLIRRWVSIGRDDVLSKEEIEHESRQTKDLLDKALGKDSIPKYPIFVLILLQYIEIGRDINTAIANGSHGFLFEALITRSLDAHARSHPINTTNDYLAHFAKTLWLSDTPTLDSTKFNQLHDEFVRINMVHVNRDLLIRDLEKARVLVTDSRGVAFRYPYHFYYYLARWITSEASDDTSAAIDKLVEHIHTEKSANVLMFIAYREREQDVLKRLIPLATSLYKDIKDIPSLEHQSQLSLRFKTIDDKAVLLVGKPDAVSDEHNKHSDELERNNRRASESEIRDSLHINTSIKTMQVLGQVLRSRASAIPADTKILIANEIISLSRRMMAYLCEFVHESSEQLVHLLSDALEKALAVDRDEAVRLANQAIGLLVTGISRICFGRSSSALASSELRPLLDAMAERLKEQDELLIILLARIASEAEYPDNDVNRALHGLTEANVLSRGLLAWSVSRRFYLDPPEHSLRDSACKRLGIEQKKLPARLAGLPGPKPRW